MTTRLWTKRQVIRGGTLTAFALAASLPTQSWAQDNTDNKGDTQELEAVTFTGSRIQALDVEPISPILVQTGDDLKNSGYQTVGDALRSLPFNSGQALTTTDSGTSFTPGVSTLNLRGLGNNQVLVLINGRRTAPYASPGFNGFQTMFDLNSIPAAAIDRIEILKDGASAIYGSDAVAGVINVILRKDYEGMYTSAEYGDYSDTGGALKQISVVAGTSSAKSSLIVALNYQQQDSVFARDLSYSKDADKTNLAHKAHPKYIVDNPEASGLPGVTDTQSYLDAIGLTNPIDDGWFDNRSSRGFPGYVNSPTYGKFHFASPTDNPTMADAVGGVQYYNYQTEAGLFPEYRMMSFYTRATHEVTDHLAAAVEVSMSRVNSKVYSASVPADLQGSQGLFVGSQLTFPAFNPFNPTGEDLTNGSRRLIEEGDRINDVTSDTPRILGTLSGDFDMGEHNMKWEVGALYSGNTVSNVSRNGVPDYKMQQALYGLKKQGDGSLTWDPSGLQTDTSGNVTGWDASSGDHVYYNWFGTNSQAMADFLKVNNPNTARFDLYMYDASVTGPIATLPAGDLGFAFGVESRKETFQSDRSDLNATGMMLGGDSGSSSYGDRSLDAVYAELQIPVVKMLTFDIAGRYEDYSDKGFKSEVRPKVAFRFRPLSWLLFKGSFQQSFKAPDLAYLYTSDTVTLSSYQVQDPVTGQQIDQIEQHVQGNPDLKPELTDTYYGGVFFEPSGILEGLNIGVEYLNYQQTDLLAQLSDYYSYGEILTRAAAGEDPFASSVVRDPNTNEVLYMLDNFQNISKAEYKGFDFTVSYHWDTETFGSFETQWLSTYINSYKIDGGEISGSYLTPKWRHNIYLGWTYGDWKVNGTVGYVGGFTRNYLWGSLVGDESVWVQYRTDAQIRANLSVTYSGLWGTDLTVGVTNLLNSDPPMDPFEGSGSTPGLYDETPQFWWVRIERQF